MPRVPPRPPKCALSHFQHLHGHSSLALRTLTWLCVHHHHALQDMLVFPDNSTPAAHSSHPPSPWHHPRLSFYCFKPLGSDQPPSPLCPCECNSVTEVEPFPPSRVPLCLAYFTVMYWGACFKGTIGINPSAETCRGRRVQVTDSGNPAAGELRASPEPTGSRRRGWRLVLSGAGESRRGGRGHE